MPLRARPARIGRTDQGARSSRAVGSHGIAADLDRAGTAVVPPLIERLNRRRARDRQAARSVGTRRDRRHRSEKSDRRRARRSSARVRLQAARSAGIRRDKPLSEQLVRLPPDRDPAVRREAAIALGRLGDAAAVPALYKALGDADVFAAWSVRQAIRRLNAWERTSWWSAILDERRLEPALSSPTNPGRSRSSTALPKRCRRRLGAGARADRGQHRGSIAQVSRVERQVVRNQSAGRRVSRGRPRTGIPRR